MKKVFLLACLIFAFGLIFAGGGKDSSEAELNLLWSGSPQPSEKIFIQTFIKMFEAQYDCTVNLTYASQGDAQKKIETEITSGNIVTDVVHVDTANMSPYITNGWVQDITEIKDTLTVTITDMFDASTNKDGKTYFLPLSYDIYITIYNKQALPYIPSDVRVKKDSSGNITEIIEISWEQYKNWGIAIADAGMGAKTGFPMATTGSQLLYPMGGVSLAYGADSYPLLNDDGSVEAWNLLAEMAAGEAILPEAILSEVNQPTALLQSGDMWMAFAHMSPVGTAYKANPDNYVLGPGPIGATGKAGSTAGAWTEGIVVGAKNQKLAGDWLKFIADPEINYLYCSNMGGLMSPILEVEEQLTGEAATDKIMSVGLSMIENGAIVTGLPTSNYTSWNAVKEVYTALYKEILMGSPITQSIADGYEERLKALEVK